MFNKIELLKMGNVSISSSQTKLIQDCWNSDHSNNDKFLKKLDGNLF